jgi:hypothetical protein
MKKVRITNQTCCSRKLNGVLVFECVPDDEQEKVPATEEELYL